MSERIVTIQMTVKIPVADYDDVLPELLGDIERAAQDQLIEYQTPMVTRPEPTS
jgi:hypothetical protein